MTDASATLVDANVLLDIITEDPNWATWSSDALASAADESILVINPSYGEVSIGFSRIEDLDEPCRPRTFRADQFPGPPRFWPLGASSSTAGAAEPNDRRLPTSTSGLTLPWPVSGY